MEETFHNTYYQLISRNAGPGDDITYVSPITYNTFFGFVTATYTVCYASAPCQVFSATWWCGCSGYNER